MQRHSEGGGCELALGNKGEGRYGAEEKGSGEEALMGCAALPRTRLPRLYAAEFDAAGVARLQERARIPCACCSRDPIRHLGGYDGLEAGARGALLGSVPICVPVW